MAYNDLIQKEGIKQQFLCVMKPAREVSSWTLLASGVYYSPFDYGNVVKVTVDGTELSENTSTSLSNNEFYYDYANEVLYVKTDGSDPSSNYVIVYYEIFVGTFDGHWYRIPTDNTSRVVYYEPYIAKAPEIKITLTDSLFGYLPVQGTALMLNNAEHFFEKHIYDSSFNKKQIDIYHCLGDISGTTFKYDTNNIKKIVTGYMQNINYNESNVSILVNDKVDILNTEYRNPAKSFYNTVTFPELAPSFAGRSIRFVYGMAEKIRCINIDYLKEAPTTSDNRKWGVRDEGAKANTASGTVPASPASTNTRTYLDDATGFVVGDAVYLNKATDEYRHVTLVDYASNYIEHATLSSGACATADVVTRSTIGNVTVIQNGEEYEPMFTRDYTETVTSGVLTLQFTTSMEANLGMVTLTSNEKVYCRCYGKQNDVTLGGSPFGSDSTTYGNLTNAAVILFDLMVNRLGIPETDINTASFVTFEAEDIELGFALPQKAAKNFPLFKSIFNDIIQSCLLRIFFDSDDLWKVEVYTPLSSSTWNADNTEILKNTFRYLFKYTDIISDINIEYLYREMDDTVQTKSATSDVARYLHEIEKQRTYSSFLLDSTVAQTLADRYSYIFGDRQGQANINVKTRFFPSEINDTFEITREKLPGYEYIEGTDRTRLLSVIALNKSLENIKITLDDEKGANDNSGSW